MKVSLRKLSLVFTCVLVALYQLWALQAWHNNASVSLVVPMAMATLYFAEGNANNTSTMNLVHFDAMRTLSALHGFAWSAPIDTSNEPNLNSPYYGVQQQLPSKMISFSQFLEDIVIVEHFFWGVVHGTFVELGAYNGLRMSNTWLLEEYFGWRGVLLEANPFNYMELVQNRPRAITAQLAATHAPASEVPIMVGGGSSSLNFTPHRRNGGVLVLCMGCHSRTCSRLLG